MSEETDECVIVVVSNQKTADARGKRGLYPVVQTQTSFKPRTGDLSPQLQASVGGGVQALQMRIPIPQGGFIGCLGIRRLHWMPSYTLDALV